MTDNPFSRKDFLKLGGVGAATVAVLTTFSEAGQYLEKETVLFGARQFLIRNENMPPDVKNAPPANEHFMFADEFLQKAIDRYELRSLKEKLPSLFYRRPKNYIDFKSLNFLSDYSTKIATDYGAFFGNVIGAVATNGGDISKLPDSVNAEYQYFFSKVQMAVLNYATNNETFGDFPIQFSNRNLYNPADILSFNPGSVILNKICKKLNIDSNKSLNNAVTENIDFLPAFHEEIDPILQWVDEYVVKTGKPMNPDVLLTELFVRNKGDMAGSMYDLLLILKLGARNNPETYQFNVLSDGTPEGAKHLGEVKKHPISIWIVFRIHLLPDFRRTG